MNIENCHDLFDKPTLNIKKTVILIINFLLCSFPAFTAGTNIENFYRGNFVLRCNCATEEFERKNEWKSEELVIDKADGCWDLSAFGENILFSNHTLNGGLLYYKMPDPGHRRVILYDPVSSWKEEVNFATKFYLDKPIKTRFKCLLLRKKIGSEKIAGKNSLLLIHASPAYDRQGLSKKGVEELSRMFNKDDMFYVLDPADERMAEPKRFVFDVADPGNINSSVPGDGNHWFYVGDRTTSSGLQNLVVAGGYLGGCLTHGIFQIVRRALKENRISECLPLTLTLPQNAVYERYNYTDHKEVLLLGEALKRKAEATFGYLIRFLDTAWAGAFPALVEYELPDGSWKKIKYGNIPSILFIKSPLTYKRTEQ